MKLRITLLFIILTAALSLSAAGRITLKASEAPAEAVFVEAMRQARLNYVYPAGLLDTVTVTVDATDRPVKWVLDKMFRNAPLRYSIKNNTVTLTGAKARRQLSAPLAPLTLPVRSHQADSLCDGEALPVLTVTGINAGNDPYARRHTVHHLDAAAILRAPALMGESDVVKALQLEPGVSPGVEGFSGMHVHGGQNDGNLYLLDDVPMYQIYHVGGLFSAFNPDQVQRLDFYKSAFPSRFDGRLSSVVDVTAVAGDTTGHHGSVRLGLTSGSANLRGSLGKRTTYSVGLRRSWYDVLTRPLCWALNKYVTEPEEEKVSIGYAFTDLNLKLTHRIDSRSTLTLSGYWGDDRLGVESNSQSVNRPSQWSSHADNRLRWGNIVGRLAWDYAASPALSVTTAASFTRYYSSCRTKSNWDSRDSTGSYSERSGSLAGNSVDDYTLKSRLVWLPGDGHRLSAGVSATAHRFQPNHGDRWKYSSLDSVSVRDDIRPFGGMTLHAFASDSWQASDRFTLDYGLGLSHFRADGRGHTNLCPRINVAYALSADIDVSAAYDRNVQYIRQLSQSYISLPTDQWLPVTAGFKPQTSDQLSLSASWRPSEFWTIHAQAYWSRLHNIIEYGTMFYLKPAADPAPLLDNMTAVADLTAAADRRISTGDGTAKGVDLKLTRNFGRLSGQIGYSLMWSDRTFADRNNGLPYPARCDNRHKINLLVNWIISPRWELSAAWTGMSGNRITLPTQQWEFAGSTFPVVTQYNNYRLPFYHRLDLNFTRHTGRGYWQFGLYNAYNRANAVTVAYKTTDSYHNRPVVKLRKMSLLPVMPSISYTWVF